MVDQKHVCIEISSIYYRARTGIRTEEDIETMNLDVSFGVNGIRKTSKLGDPAEVRNEVLLDLSSTSSLTDVFEFLVVD